ncbi:CdaR family protein [Alteribacter populi]|uniref:CdaR family protein n=1 Tax=Alteribacter populi TaxID=2011011 RepID=UPI000BBAC3AE|nr:CdaR family protein [Alteribacter populi]
MDKWFNNKWFIRGISLLIAIMLYMMVSMDNVGNQQAGGIPGITNGHRVIEEVDLTIYYNEDEHVVTEAPETVQVNLRGPQNVLTLLQVTRPQYEVFIDLTDKEPGEHYERVQYSGFPSDLSVSIVPMTVRVGLQEKQTSSFPIDIELENEGELEEGYTLGNPSVDPSSVDVTAASGLVEQVASAQVLVDLSGRDGTFEESASVILLDASGNPLPITPDPSAVDVEVPITSPNKEVPVRIEREGDPPEGFAISSVEADPSDVTIYGPVSVINEISFLEGIDVDLSEITEDTTLEVDVPVPDGVERVDPETISVDIEIEEEESRSYNNVPIEIVGLEDGKEVELVSPGEAFFDLEIMGTATLLERISREDIEAFVDLEGVEAGEYDLPITVNGPQHLRFTKGMNEVSLIVYDDEASAQNANDDVEIEDDIETEDDEDTENSETEIEEEPEEEENSS